MFPPAGPGGRPQLLRVLLAEPGRPGGCRGRGRLHGHGGLEGLGPGAVNNNVIIILYASINCVCLKLVMWLCYDEVKPFSFPFISFILPSLINGCYAAIKVNGLPLLSHDLMIHDVTST